jgi:GNAT superfamily N-acetyltransferase
MIEIKEIPTELTYSVRQAILRPGKPIENCFFEGDKLDTTTHYGIFIDKEVVGVVSVFLNSNINFTETTQFQLRGMAISDSVQRKGLGKLLLDEVENCIFQKNGNLVIWFNARESAVAFYKKSKYQMIDEPFDIEGIGTHYIMYKKQI